jgi:RNA polymerase sigma-70 factor (ECF subfamily)
MGATAFDFADLYTAECGRLRRFVSRLVGNGAAADDLVQQAFLKLIVAGERDDLQNYPAYLTHVVRNLAFNHLRDLGRRGEVFLPEGELNTVADSRPSPEEAAIFRSELRRVLKAVAALPNRRRQAFILNKFEGLSYDEIAARLCISRNTVISHIVIALADLDRMLSTR